MSNLYRVTISGADDEVSVDTLLELSKEYPFVEWGILISKKEGRPRYPSLTWLKDLHKVYRKSGEKMNLSAHLCGDYVRELLAGNFSAYRNNPYLWQMFNRVQINFAGEPSDAIYNKSYIEELKLFSRFQYIFQLDGVNDRKLEFAQAAGINAVGLHDRSGGKGLKPRIWPVHIKKGMYMEKHTTHVGYAGGLGPDNIADELHHINMAATNADYFWIDMESGVRVNNQFSILCVKCVLAIIKAGPYNPDKTINS